MESEIKLRPVAMPALSEQPLVSVLLPVHNYARYLARAIASVLEQSYTNFELIICDDGSTDASLGIARQFASLDLRVKVVHKENGGQASALNAAWKEHRGEIVCILDADDLFLLHKLELLVREYQQNPDVGVLVHSMILLDAHERQIETIPFLSQFERGWIGDKLIRRGGRWRFMPSSALSFRSALGSYCMPIPEQEFRKSAESFVFTILPLFTCVGYIREPLSCYRMHDANMSGEFAFNTATLRYREACMRVPTDAVNAQLASMGYPQRLDLHRNLDFAMIRFKRYMLEDEPLAVRLKYYRHLVSLAFHDDLMGIGGKFLVILGHGASLLVGRSARQWIFDQMISPNPLKRFIRSLQLPDSGSVPPVRIDGVPEA